MKILGIDPGLGIVGYSIVEYGGETPVLLHSGSIQTQKGARESARLLEIFEDMNTIVEKYRPDCAAIEKLFFFKKSNNCNACSPCKRCDFNCFLKIPNSYL